MAQAHVITIMDEFRWDVEEICNALLEEREKSESMNDTIGYKEDEINELNEEITALERQVSALEAQLDALR